jgi:hypothetical protein
MRHNNLIRDHPMPPECIVEARPSELDPAIEICPWREEYEANQQAAQIEIDKREEAHTAYLNDFLQQTWLSPYSPRG